jgi:hypothetical protein
MDRTFEISTSKGANHYRCGRARKNHTPKGQSLSFCFPTLACMHLDGLICVLNKFSCSHCAQDCPDLSRYVVPDPASRAADSFAFLCYHTHEEQSGTTIT